MLWETYSYLLDARGRRARSVNLARTNKTSGISTFLPTLPLPAFGHAGRGLVNFNADPPALSRSVQAIAKLRLLRPLQRE